MWNEMGIDGSLIKGTRSQIQYSLDDVPSGRDMISRLLYVFIHCTNIHIVPQYLHSEPQPRRQAEGHAPLKQLKHEALKR